MTLRYSLCALAALLLSAGPVAAQANLSGVVINEILADPNVTGGSTDFDTDGDGTSETDDEFVEFYNTSSTAVDISGWEVYQVSGGNAVLAHTFASGTELAAGGRITVVGAWDPGTPPAGIVTASVTSTRLGLTNGGDEVFLYNPTANQYIGAFYNGGQTAVTIGNGATLAGEDDFGADEASRSIQRAPDGATTLAVAGPTPNAANVTAAPEEFMTILLGANEVPTAVETDAAGSVMAVLTGTQLVVTGRFDDLDSDYAASHLHVGAVNENGPVEHALSPTLDADNRGGTFNSTIDVSSEFAGKLRDGLVYVNLHTAANGGGAIRGQLLPETPATALSLRQVRIVGPGFTVTTSGTVARAAGAFTYVQTEDGGLTVRQTSGAFADAVANGTIQAGTQLEVTGTLSEFFGLLQIDGSDLASYDVGATGTAPDPVTVTLSELASNGEAYEGRLVTVRNVTIDPNGDATFSARTNYNISDASSTSNSVDLRIPSANDTDADGTSIPAGTVDVTGVVSESSGSFQILLIRASDLQMSTSNEDALAAGLALDVANPIRSSATVQFETGAAGLARLEAFDLLGRRVAVLADGVVTDAAQTATLDADALAPGVYVLRLTTEAGTLARTVTVVR